MEEKGDGDDDEKSFMPVERFDKITYWNHDIVPSTFDTVPRNLEYLSMAEVVHST